MADGSRFPQEGPIKNWTVAGGWQEPKAEGSEWGYGVVDFSLAQGMELTEEMHPSVVVDLGAEAFNEAGVALVQTPDEREEWAIEEAARIASAPRRAVHFGRDPRDARPQDLGRTRERPATAQPPLESGPARKMSDEELAALPFGRGKGLKGSSEEELDTAAAALRRDNTQINHQTKILYN